MSNKISSFFVAKSIIKQEDIEVYEYSLEIFISTVVNFLAVALIAVFTKNILITAFYLLGFIPLRSIAGGYHAETHLRCFMILMATYLVFLCAVKFIPLTYIFYLTFVSSLLSLILIFIFAPVEDKNKPISAEEKKSFRMKSRITILVYTVVILLLLFLISNKLFAFSLALGNLSVALSLLASVIKNRIISREINAIKH